METRLLHSLSPKPQRLLPRQSTYFPRQTRFRIRASADKKQPPPDPPVLSQVSPLPEPEPLEIRYRRRSRKRRQLREEDIIGSAGKRELAARTKPPEPNKWEDMTVVEKAVELYMGEKGLLFWLNKFAYASIFIVIGGWVLFRFVGPSLNLYQLDTPPLSPQSILKG
ncbi:hypothetical protein MLD38_029583 [Melastoma candidum]|uniref:Uncharacterized protein n=1 Tax=Melastoma candidum TaxID=119954 RepID=A0ACB9N459_9MYRT|nr:hypothetical protein MLD38_029583 [Melastoma candidum]